jgi:hypothetical protein
MRYQEETSARRRPLCSLLLLAAILVVSSSTAATADTINAIGTPLDALASTAAIVEGTVKENAYTFDEKAGPLPLATLGGPINEKQGLFIPELPLLTDDTRYLVFLTNVSWFFSPVVEHYVFRLEPDANGNEFLISPSGHVVLGLSESGLQFSDDPVIDPQVDLGKPTDRNPLLDPALLTGALSKDRFLALVGRFVKTVPLQGAFIGSPATDRVWNQIVTGDDSLRNANAH